MPKRPFQTPFEYFHAKGGGLKKVGLPGLMVDYRPEFTDFRYCVELTACYITTLQSKSLENLSVKLECISSTGTSNSNL